MKIKLVLLGSGSRLEPCREDVAAIAHERHFSFAILLPFLMTSEDDFAATVLDDLDLDFLEDFEVDVDHYVSQPISQLGSLSNYTQDHERESVKKEDAFFLFFERR